MTRRAVVPESMQSLVDAGAYSPAVQVGGWLFVSGQVGRDESMKIVDSDLEAHIRATFENLRRILDCAGASMRDVVELTTYHVDMPGQMPTFTEVKKEYFSDRSTLPAWTAVGVAALNHPKFLVEIQATAYLGTKSA